MTNTPSNDQSGKLERMQKGESVPTVVCHICQAVYAPAEEYRYLSQAPQVALESAFMSMCHFCFRCRRPACPQCWDNIHGVCGECSLEANLPFRSQAAPLRGVLFPSTRQAQLRRKRAEAIRLICINPGRFQRLAPIDEAETMPYIRNTRARHSFGEQEEPASPSAPHSTSLIPPSRQRPQAIPSSPRIGRVTRDFRAAQEQNEQQFQGRPSEWLPPGTSIIPSGKVQRPFSLTAPSPQPSPAPIAAGQPSQIPVSGDSDKQVKVYTQKHRSPHHSGTAIEIEDIVTRPERSGSHKRTRTSNKDQYKQSTAPEISVSGPITNVTRGSRKAHKGIGQSIEILLTALLSTLVVIILVLAVIAIISPDANILIFHLTNIDIHSDLHNLWQIIHGSS